MTKKGQNISSNK